MNYSTKHRTRGMILFGTTYNLVNVIVSLRTLFCLLMWGKVTDWIPHLPTVVTLHPEAGFKISLPDLNEVLMWVWLTVLQFCLVTTVENPEIGSAVN